MCTVLDDVQQFAVRFKTIDLAREFLKKFEESKEFVKQAQVTKVNEAASGNAVISLCILCTIGLL